MISFRSELLTCESLQKVQHGIDMLHFRRIMLYDLDRK